MNIDPRYEHNGQRAVEQLAGTDADNGQDSSRCPHTPAQYTDTGRDIAIVLAGAALATPMLTYCDSGDLVSLHEVGHWLFAHPDGAHGLVPALAGYTLGALRRLYGPDATRTAEDSIRLAYSPDFGADRVLMSDSEQLGEQREGFRYGPALMQHMLRDDHDFTALLMRQMTETPQVAFGAAAGLAYLLPAFAQAVWGVDGAREYIRNLHRFAQRSL